LQFFDGGEMTTARHLGPTLYMEESLCPFPWRMTEIDAQTLVGESTANVPLSLGIILMPTGRTGPSIEPLTWAQQLETGRSLKGRVDADA
jgi:hypothetical protein